MTITPEHIIKTKMFFSKILTTYLKDAPDLEVAKSDLAEHLKVEISNIDDWLFHGETLPSSYILRLLDDLILSDWRTEKEEFCKQNAWYYAGAKKASKYNDWHPWGLLFETIHEIEDSQVSQILQNTKLTNSKVYKT